VDIGGSRAAYTIGIIIFVIYILSFSLVPTYSKGDVTVMRFQMTADFEGRVEKKIKKASNRNRSSTTGSSWSERAKSRLSMELASSESRLSASSELPAVEKRFFEVGDCVLWHSQQSDADAVIGTVESTSVYPEQDADELSDFVVFLKMNPSLEPTTLRQLQDAADATGGEKPVLIDSKCRSCRCQLKKAPGSHAHMPVFGWTLKSWGIMRQINVCFQLLLMSLFPAADTITDLIYILSTEFANTYLFAASLLVFIVQFVLYCNRLWKRRVFEAFIKRRIEFSFLKGQPYWPKWASPDNALVFFFMIVPFYLIYYAIFPVVWFLLGFALFSFQLFPISRISNGWLYAFV
jgi:hypothetical protein